MGSHTLLLPVSLDLAVKHASTNISPEDLQLKSTETTLITNAPTMVGYTTHLLNSQSSLCKHSTMRHMLSQLLSWCLQSLKKVRLPPVDTQNAQSSLYPGKLGNLDLNQACRHPASGARRLGPWLVYQSKCGNWPIMPYPCLVPRYYASLSQQTIICHYSCFCHSSPNSCFPHV